MNTGFPPEWGFHQANPHPGFMKNGHGPMNGVRRTMHDEREEWSREGRMDVEYDNNRLPFHASVVVSYLPESYLNEQMIVKAFQAYGRIRKIIIFRGKAFVVFESSAVAEQVAATENGRACEGSLVEVRMLKLPPREVMDFDAKCQQGMISDQERMSHRRRQLVSGPFGDEPVPVPMSNPMMPSPAPGPHARPGGMPMMGSGLGPDGRPVVRTLPMQQRQQIPRDMPREMPRMPTQQHTHQTSRMPQQMLREMQHPIFRNNTVQPQPKESVPAISIVRSFESEKESRDKVRRVQAARTPTSIQVKAVKEVKPAVTKHSPTASKVVAVKTTPIVVPKDRSNAQPSSGQQRSSESRHRPDHRDSRNLRDSRSSREQRQDTRENRDHRQHRESSREQQKKPDDHRRHQEAQSRTSHPQHSQSHHRPRKLESPLYYDQIYQQPNEERPQPKYSRDYGRTELPSAPLAQKATRSYGTYKEQEATPASNSEPFLAPEDISITIRNNPQREDVTVVKDTVESITGNFAELIRSNLTVAEMFEEARRTSKKVTVLLDGDERPGYCGVIDARGSKMNVKEVSLNHVSVYLSKNFSPPKVPSYETAEISEPSSRYGHYRPPM